MKLFAGGSHLVNASQDKRTPYVVLCTLSYLSCKCWSLYTCVGTLNVVVLVTGYDRIFCQCYLPRPYVVDLHLSASEFVVFHVEM